MFCLWAPKLYRHYRVYNGHLDNWYNKRESERAQHGQAPKPRPLRPFPAGVFAAAAFNCGPKVWTFKHRDVLNLPYGWCAVQALGRFDATKGGHLILWDLKLIIEFPPGTLILFPSATLLHSNIPVADDEERVSFTQWSAGGLFRFVDNEFKTEEQFSAAAPKRFKEAMARKETRWDEGIKYWSTVFELAASLQLM